MVYNRGVRNKMASFVFYIVVLVLWQLLDSHIVAHIYIRVPLCSIPLSMAFGTKTIMKYTFH